MSVNCAIYDYFNFQFSYVRTFYKPNDIKTKPSTKLTFKFSTIKGQINVPLWTQMDEEIKDEGWRNDGKTFIMCYAIALIFISQVIAQ